MKLFIKLCALVLVLTLSCSMAAVFGQYTNDQEGKLSLSIDAIKYTDFIVTAENRALLPGFSDTAASYTIPATFLGADGIHYRVTTIAGNAFAGCAFETLTLGRSVNVLNSYALNGMAALKNIYVESGNQSFKSIDGVLYTLDGKQILRYPNGRTDTSFVIPEGVIQTGTDSFSGCKSLEMISLPSTLLFIGTGTFYDCVNLKSIEIPNSVYYIGVSAFGCCASLTHIDIPGSVGDISNYSFSTLYGVKTIRMNEGTHSIQDNAFKNNIYMTTVYIPSTVTSIGTNAFTNCGDLKNVYFAGSEEQWAAIAIATGNDHLLNATIHYGA